MDILQTTDSLIFLDRIRYPEMHFKKNTLTFLTGASGAGKSSYLKLLNGMLPAQKDSVFYQQKPIESYDILSYRKQVLLLPQKVFLVKGSIQENFDFYYEHRKEKRRSIEEIKEFLAAAKLSKSPTDVVDNFSGGERHRLFLAIFLSFAQEVFLLDEPTAALDEKTANALLASLKAYFLEKGITAVCIAHDNRLAEKYGDQWIRLEGGSDESGH